MKKLALLALGFASLPAHAAEVGPCLGLDKQPSLVLESRQFAQGGIRVSVVDTEGEPVCCSSHLMIQVKAGSGKACFLVSQKAGNREEFATGWVKVELEKLSANYDPAKGLHLSVPVYLYDFDGTHGNEPVPAGNAKVLVNRSHGAKVTIEN